MRDIHTRFAQIKMLYMFSAVSYVYTALYFRVHLVDVIIRRYSHHRDDHYSVM